MSWAPQRIPWIKINQRQLTNPNGAVLTTPAPQPGRTLGGQEVRMPPPKRLRRPTRRKLTPEQELRATAYHEAGHAVAFRHHDIPFEVASIIPDEADDSLGHVTAAFPARFHLDSGTTSVRQRIHAERRIIALLAGPAAEARHLRRPVLPINAASDYRNVVGLGSPLFPNMRTLNAFIEFCDRQAQDVLDARWSAVSEVAAELLRKRTLSLDEVDAAISVGLFRRPRA